MTDLDFGENWRLPEKSEVKESRVAIFERAASQLADDEWMSARAASLEQRRESRKGLADVAPPDRRIDQRHFGCWYFRLGPGSKSG